MQFTPIDFDRYPRKEHYLHYANSTNCTYSITVNLDITGLENELKANRLKLYPTMIFVVTRAVNAFPEFRMAVVDDILGVYDEVSPSYLIFHKDDNTFTSISTPYQSDFTAFYNALEHDMEKHKDTHGFSVGTHPTNSFSISCIPWTSYTHLNLNIPYEANYYAPIITWGKHFSENDKVLLPMTVQANHAVTDGYHISLLFEEMQKTIRVISGQKLN